MHRLTKIRGSVLVIVLVTLLFATFAIIAFVEKASVDLLVEVRESSALRLRQQAYSALEVTLSVLEEFRQAGGGLRSPAEGWNDPLAFAGWTPAEGCTAEVTFEDESGKISLAHVDPATLIELFKSWELPQSDAEKLTDALLSWMKKDYVPSSSFSPDYDRGALPYAAPARSLRSFSELAAIEYAREVFYDKEGRPNDLWHRFASAFSLYDFNQTNLNSARPDALAALGTYDQFQQRALGDFLSGAGMYAQQGPGFFKTTADATTILGGKSIPAGFGTDIRALRINITLHQGSSQFRLTAVIAPPNGATTVPAAPLPTASSSSVSNDSAKSGAPAPPPAASPAPAKKLNYPFTLLEIRENIEIPPVPAPPPQA